jgi:hypothetical protein
MMAIIDGLAKILLIMPCNESLDQFVMLRDFVSTSRRDDDEWSKIAQDMHFSE